jgi:hypothetical protein
MGICCCLLDPQTNSSDPCGTGYKSDMPLSGESSLPYGTPQLLAIPVVIPLCELKAVGMIV